MKMKMKISHETPIELLNAFASVNDYDYALIHLMKNAEYRRYFVNAIKSGRLVYLDNSVFELGLAFDIDEFTASAIKYAKMSPNNNFVAIAPDVLNDKRATVTNLIKFRELVGESMQVMGVLQGSNADELFECYDDMFEYADIIGVNHISVAFDGFGKHPLDDFYRQSENRIAFVKELCKRMTTATECPLHLLGVLHPWEIAELSHLKQVVSADTSNPVCLALEGKSYNETLYRKPLWTIDHWIKSGLKMNVSQKLLALHNANAFKGFIA